MRSKRAARVGRRILGTFVGVALLAACGSSAGVQTLDHTPDYGGAAIPLTHTLPSGLSSVGVDPVRLVAGCRALDVRVAAAVPEVGSGTAAMFDDGRCVWNGPDGPAVIVGMIVETSGASFTLDETKVFTDDERTISGIGQRAVYDPQTHALYVSISNRLWYVQLVGGAAAAPSALQNVSAIGRALANTPGAQ
jgi:hypothetical protein